jgi:hypothetical protein
MFIETLIDRNIDLNDVDLTQVSTPKGLSKVALGAYSLAES